MAGFKNREELQELLLDEAQEVIQEVIYGTALDDMSIEEARNKLINLCNRIHNYRKLNPKGKMKLKELRRVINADMVNIEWHGKENYFVKEKNSESNEYLSISKDSLSMWCVYGEYEIKEIYTEEEILIIVIEYQKRN